MASLTQWTWVWASSWSWWWTGKPGMLQSMGSQRVRHNWVTELSPNLHISLSWVISSNIPSNSLFFSLTVFKLLRDYFSLFLLCEFYYFFYFLNNLNRLMLIFLLSSVSRVYNQFSSVQSLSSALLFVTLWTAAYQASLSFTNSQNLLKVISIESVMPSNYLILCHPFLFLPSIFPIIRVFSNESVLCIRWPKYWSFSLSTSPSNEYSGLISFRIDWFYLHSSKASAFFIVQLSHPYMTIGKTIALTRWTLLAKSCLCFLICYLGWS